jgi:nucleoside recognition membrane protein YjiH
MAETLPEGYSGSVDYGISLAVKRVEEHRGIGQFLENGITNAAGMWFGVLPVVMCIGTLALVLASYTPIFEILGAPFVPLLELLQVPEAAAASQTMVVGFTDMFTPSVIAAAMVTDPMTKFIIAVISVTQLIYLSEVGGLILGSKIPVNLLELFIIFLERTIISLIIGVVVSLIVSGVLKGQLKSVHKQHAAGNYVRSGSMHVTTHNDFFLYRTVSRTAKPKNNSSSSGGGGSRSTGGGKF